MTMNPSSRESIMNALKTHGTDALAQSMHEIRINKSALLEQFENDSSGWSSKLEKVKLFYESVILSLVDWGFDLQALDQQITLKVYTQLNQVLPPVIQLLDDTLATGRTLATEIPEFSTSILKPFDAMYKDVQIIRLTSEFPSKMKDLLDIVLYGVKEPSLLSPKAICSSRATTTPDEIFKNAIEFINKMETEAQTRDTSVVGSSQRSMAWKAVESDLDSVVVPLTGLILSFAEFIGLMSSANAAIEPASNSVRYIEKLLKVQENIASQAKEIMSLIQSTTSASSNDKDLSETDPPQTFPTHALATTPTSASEQLQRQFTNQTSFQSIYQCIDLSYKLGYNSEQLKTDFVDLTASSDFCRTLCEACTSILKKCNSTNHENLTKGLMDLNDQYAHILQQSCQIIRVKGFFRCFFSPLPYAQTVENTVRDVEAFLKIPSIASSISPTCRHMTQVMQGDQVGSMVSRKSSPREGAGDLISKQFEKYMGLSNKVFETLETQIQGPEDGLSMRMINACMKQMSESLDIFVREIEEIIGT